MVTSGGRLDAADVTLTDLGTSDSGPEPRPPSSSTPTAPARWSGPPSRNSVGLQLDGSRDVRIEDVTVTESLGHGLAISRDSGTVLRGIRAERNAGNGVASTPAWNEPVTGVSTSGNGRFGIAAIKLRNVRIEDVRSTGDAAGGLELSQEPPGSPWAGSPPRTSRSPWVRPRHVRADVRLERLAVRGGRRGVAVEKTTHNLVVAASAFDRRVRVAGVVIGGSGVQLRDVAVTDAQTGVRIERGAEDVTLTGLRLQGGGGRGGRDGRHARRGPDRPVGDRR